jgi:YgiT-type zinc finger domain-containing protein
MPASVARCTQCGADGVRQVQARSAFWHDDQLVVVEDIPALQCARCGEQFYDDATIVALDLLRGRGFAAGEARREMTVAVFSLLEAAEVPEAGAAQEAP